MRQSLVILLLVSLLANFAGPGLWLHDHLDHQDVHSSCDTNRVLVVPSHDHADHDAPPPMSRDPKPHAPGHDCEWCHWLTSGGWAVSYKLILVSQTLRLSTIVSLAKDDIPHLWIFHHTGERDPPGLAPILV